MSWVYIIWLSDWLCHLDHWKGEDEKRRKKEKKNVEEKKYQTLYGSLDKWLYFSEPRRYFFLLWIFEWRMDESDPLLQMWCHWYTIYLLPKTGFIIWWCAMCIRDIYKILLKDFVSTVVYFLYCYERDLFFVCYAF